MADGRDRRKIRAMLNLNILNSEFDVNNDRLKENKLKVSTDKKGLMSRKECGVRGKVCIYTLVYTYKKAQPDITA